VNTFDWMNKFGDFWLDQEQSNPEAVETAVKLELDRLSIDYSSIWSGFSHFEKDVHLTLFN